MKLYEKSDLQNRDLKGRIEQLSSENRSNQETMEHMTNKLSKLGHEL
jgi:hypothetical protein